MNDVWDDFRRDICGALRLPDRLLFGGPSPFDHEASRDMAAYAEFVEGLVRRLMDRCVGRAQALLARWDMRRYRRLKGLRRPRAFRL